MGIACVKALSWQLPTHARELQLTALPAIHHSKCALFDTNTPIWAVFLFEYRRFKLYFGRGSTMGPVFRETGHKYGTDDLASIGICA